MTSRPRHRPTLAVANQKGGVAKTTSVASLGAALAELGHSVLLVDLDPQACLTFSLGIDPEDVEMSIHHVLTKGMPLARSSSTTDDGVDLLPATIELARAEADLLTRTGREQVLKTALATCSRRRIYDWVLLDCPPSLGVLTVAALTAADGVLIPLQCETLSHRGVGQLLDTVHDVRRFTNRDLDGLGRAPDAVRRPHQPRAHGARDDQPTPTTSRCIEPPIPKTIKFAEAPAAGRSILATSRSSKGAKAYREAATHLVERAQRPRQPRARPAPHEASPAPPRSAARPRYARMAAAGASLAVTLIAVMGGFGVLPVSSARRRPGTRRRPNRRGATQPTADP